MNDSTYRPWRSACAEDDVLAGQVSANWRQLLDESKQAVTMLRQATVQADRRLDTSRHLLSAMQSRSHHSQLDRIMHRLNALEQRLSQVETRLAVNHVTGPALHRHAA